jgi:hypothetical protein
LNRKVRESVTVPGVLNFKQFVNIFDKADTEFMSIKFRNGQIIHIDTKKGRNSFTDIKQQYGLSLDRSLN